MNRDRHWAALDPSHHVSHFGCLAHHGKKLVRTTHLIRKERILKSVFELGLVEAPACATGAPTQCRCLSISLFPRTLLEASPVSRYRFHHRAGQSANTLPGLLDNERHLRKFCMPFVGAARSCRTLNVEFLSCGRGEHGAGLPLDYGGSCE